MRYFNSANRLISLIGMKMEKEMVYVAPAVEVIEVAVEKGFAGSITGDSGDGTLDNLTM